MAYTVNIDGNLFTDSDAGAKISVLDHGFLYGDGVFEGMRTYDGRIFREEEHLDRLDRSAKVLALKPRWDRARLQVELQKTLAAARQQMSNAGKQADDLYIRLIFTRGSGPLGLDPFTCGESSTIIIVGNISLYPKEYYDNGIAVVTAATRRPLPDVSEARVKSLNYLGSIMAKIEARAAGCLEAVMLNQQGFVAECTADNIFVVAGGTVLTPPASEGALEGITRGYVLDLCAQLGIAAREQRLSRYDLYAADECFMTGSGAEMVPVTSVDSRAIGSGRPGPLTSRLMTAFHEGVRRASV